MRYPALAALVILTVVAAACDDSTFRIDPLLVTDTVEIATPAPGNVGLPTALDVTSVGAGIRGGRFPERAADAAEWDFAVRERGGEVVLVPAAVLGLQTRPAITRAIANRTFESLIEAPGRTSFLADSAVTLRVGNVYAARSRLVTTEFGSSCEQYAKLQPLAVDPVLGRVRLQITTNERCSDPRLALED